MLFTEEELVGKDNSPLDDTEINTTLLYYSKEEMQEFKKLCKTAMKAEFPQTFQDSNISDLLLKILRDKYANITT